jgi:hypothetical protein
VDEGFEDDDLFGAGELLTNGGGGGGYGGDPSFDSGDDSIVAIPISDDLTTLIDETPAPDYGDDEEDDTAVSIPSYGGEVTVTATPDDPPDPEDLPDPSDEEDDAAVVDPNYGGEVTVTATPDDPQPDPNPDDLDDGIEDFIPVYTESVTVTATPDDPVDTIPIPDNLTAMVPQQTPPELELSGIDEGAEIAAATSAYAQLWDPQPASGLPPPHPASGSPSPSGNAPSLKSLLPTDAHSCNMAMLIVLLLIVGVTYEVS